MFRQEHMTSYSESHLNKMIKSANIIQKTWLKKHPRNCPICMDLIHNNSGCVVTPCGHNFCLRCYLKLKDPRCPLCRSDILLLSYTHNVEDSEDSDDNYDNDTIEFRINPVRFIGNLIYAIMVNPINVMYREQNMNIQPPSEHSISGIKYAIVGTLLVMSIFSPYISIYMLSLLIMVYSPMNINRNDVNISTQNPQEHLSRQYQNPMFQRQYQNPMFQRQYENPMFQRQYQRQYQNPSRMQTFSELFEESMRRQFRILETHYSLYGRPYDTNYA